jgi:hypothetical protein
MGLFAHEPFVEQKGGLGFIGPKTPEETPMTEEESFPVEDEHCIPFSNNALAELIEATQKLRGQNSVVICESTDRHLSLLSFSSPPQWGSKEHSSPHGRGTVIFPVLGGYPSRPRGFSRISPLATPKGRMGKKGKE